MKFSHSRLIFYKYFWDLSFSLSQSNVLGSKISSNWRHVYSQISNRFLSSCKSLGGESVGGKSMQTKSQHGQDWEGRRRFPISSDTAEITEGRQRNQVYFTCLQKKASGGFPRFIDPPPHRCTFKPFVLEAGGLLKDRTGEPREGDWLSWDGPCQWVAGSTPASDADIEGSWFSYLQKLEVAHSLQNRDCSMDCRQRSSDHWWQSD